MFPSYPAFPSLRLATPEDIPRMADLSVLGFKDSEIFRYERPNYEEYPQDAVASFCNIYRSQLLNPRAVVIVAEDWQQGGEVSHFAQNGANGDAPAQRVVVGVGSWILPAGSPREGQFVPPGIGEPFPAPDRDLCKHRLGIFTGISDATEEKYFDGKTVFNKLVVHPSYQRRGHGTTIIKWGQLLSDLDQVDQGVIPAHVGEPVYLSVGYKKIGEMHIPDDGEVQGFTQSIVLYKSRSK